MNQWVQLVSILGNYSRLACEFQFVRSMGYYLIQIYIPASLIVVISWVSFWLNRGATPARVMLGVTTVLTMTTLISSTNASLPKISYVKSIDAYLAFCFFMVFASLIGKLIDNISAWMRMHRATSMCILIGKISICMRSIFMSQYKGDSSNVFATQRFLLSNILYS